MSTRKLEMIHHFARNYHSILEPTKILPSLRFYWNMVKIVGHAGYLANRGKYPAEQWVQDSFEVTFLMEKLGASVKIEGYEHIESLNGPCVFVSNHMSTLETFALPCIIQPKCDVTFVIKESLLKYPGLGPVLKARDPITLTRTNPRQDLAKVLDEGVKHLSNGKSIIIFPQGTRYPNVDSENFSSLGVKLAKKANVPVIPIALKTDAWGTSSVTKDFGKISPAIPIRFNFGEAMDVKGNGKEEHAKCMNFITTQFQRFIDEQK